MLLAHVPLACARQDYDAPRSTDVCLPGRSLCAKPASCSILQLLNQPSPEACPMYPCRDRWGEHTTNFVTSQICCNRCDLDIVRHVQADHSHDDHHQVHVQEEPPVNCRGTCASLFFAVVTYDVFAAFLHVSEFLPTNCSPRQRVS